jgi:ABC-type phosphate transport system ATPase subunit
LTSLEQRYVIATVTESLQQAKRAATTTAVWFDASVVERGPRTRLSPNPGDRPIERDVSERLA